MAASFLSHITPISPGWSALTPTRLILAATHPAHWGQCAPPARTARLLRTAARLLSVLAVCSTLPATEPAGLTSIPLHFRSGPRGATLFATLPPEQTGVRAENPYDDPAMWTRHYREFSLGAIGTGVAIADYDGDGRPDIFVVSKTGPDHLFRNLGDFHFEDVTDRAGVAGPPFTGAWKQGVAFADVNNDGRPDIYVCRFNAPNLLYINQGSGAFKEEAEARGLALNDSSSMAAFCDYDRDGWLDVQVQTNLLDGERRPNGQRDRLFHNNRGGTFTDVTDAAGLREETQCHAATWWDYDEDGWPDLYVDNDFRDPDQFYHNNRNGTFSNVLSAVVPHTPHSSMGADLGDLNNDGHIDLLIADMASPNRTKDHRGMAKLRDGLTEDDQRPHAAPQYMRNSLFLGTGGSRVLEAAYITGLSATDWTWSVRLEDLDLDGRVDAYFTNGMVRELHGDDLVKRMIFKESMAERIRLVKAAPVLAEQHLAFRNLGDLRFENVSHSWGLDQVGVGFGAAFGDLDGDGDLDLVFASMDTPVTVCRNDADSGHVVIFDLRGTTSNRFGIGATVRLETDSGPQVRTLTLQRGYLSTSEPIIHFGLGATTTIRRVTVEWPSGHRQEFSALAADRRYTITEPNTPAPPLVPPPRAKTQFTESSEKLSFDVASKEKPLNEFTAQLLLPFRFNRPGPAIAIADFDSDGEDDLVVGGASGESTQLLSNFGDGQFLASAANLTTEATAVADGPILAFDANADGHLDLLVTKTGVGAAADAPEYEIRLQLNNGRGRFTPAPTGMIPALSLSVGAAVAADFEHSGRPGIFLGGRVVPGKYPHAPRSALLAWRGDHYADVTAELAPALAQRGMVAAALWSDVDGDGWIDLLVAYDWGQVTCYRNVGGKRFEDVSEKFGFAAAGNGWWRSITAADFNGDGRLDYAVGNTGLNTRYQASPTEPTVMYADVVLDGSAPQLVEVQTAAGKHYPLRSREIMVKAFPSLKSRFPTAESYAVATLEEVFPPEVLAKATKFTATELSSGVFLSQADGAEGTNAGVTYRFAALPRLAQLAPIHGLVAGDFDGDGRADLMAVGNSYAPTTETGRFDGALGWMLRGDGHGAFTPVSSIESGFIVPGDARGLAVTDLDKDGWPDLLATRNNDRALVFLNHPMAGRQSFAVVLRGAAGNPNAIGALLTLTHTDGSTQTAELSAGSGYFSQSGARLFFGYPEKSPPVSLRIRWPDGRVTEQKFTSSPAKLLRISAP